MAECVQETQPYIPQKMIILVARWSVVSVVGPKVSLKLSSCAFSEPHCVGPVGVL